MHDEANERKAIEDALRDALARDELRLLYQPIVDIARERISGFEALIRWERDGGGVSPTTFIPIAEESNLIVPIGEWITRTACPPKPRRGPGHPLAVTLVPARV